MSKAKLIGIVILMVCIASVSTISAEVFYSTELNSKDLERINTCKENIEKTMASLTDKDLARANKILSGIAIELAIDQTAHKGSRTVGSDKKDIAPEMYSTLTSEALEKSGYSKEACGGLGKYFYDKGYKDYLDDQQSEGTKDLAYTINNEILKALGSQTRRGWYNVGYNDAKLSSASTDESKDVGE